MKGLRWAMPLAGVVVAAIGVSLFLAPEARARSTQESVEPGYADASDCAVCHEDAAETHRRSVHSQLDSGDWGIAGCQACHGPGAAHVESGGEAPMLFSSGSEMTAKEQTDVCVGCHSGNTTFTFQSSDHMKGTVTCSDCHKTHEAAGNDALLAKSGQDVCLTCHEEMHGQGELYSRHRVAEGVVACTDCHTQHDPARRTRLGGFKNSTCVNCHTDKEGPFVFEHAAGRVEGCVACHDPHGSTNRHMLAYQNQGDLCYSCHTLVPGFHAPPRFQSDTNCTNCHTQIHGSNLHPAYLK